MFGESATIVEIVMIIKIVMRGDENFLSATRETSDTYHFNACIEGILGSGGPRNIRKLFYDIDTIFFTNYS